MKPDKQKLAVQTLLGQINGVCEDGLNLKAYDIWV